MMSLKREEAPATVKKKKKKKGPAGAEGELVRLLTSDSQPGRDHAEGRYF